MRVPNVCFNKSYCPVLIDFADVSETRRECALKDFKIFNDDVLKHLCQLENFMQNKLNEDEKDNIRDFR